MIEFWQPGCIKPLLISPEELKMDHVLPEEDHDIRTAIQGMMSFIDRLYMVTPPIDGVAYSRISQPPAPDNIYVSVLASLVRGSEESAEIVRAVGKAHADLHRSVYPLMGTGLSFYDSVHTRPDSFVQLLRDKSRRSRTEKLAGVWLFRR